MSESQSWTWVKDLETGHLYDVQTERLPLDGVQVVAAKQQHFGPYPRPPKHHVDLDGRPKSVPAPADDTRAADAAETQEK